MAKNSRRIEFREITLPPGFRQAHEDNLPLLPGNRREDARELHSREGGICWLCHARVDLNLRTPHPASAEIDHVMPRALGGLMVWGNVHLAHRQCNAFRSNSAPETYAADEYWAAVFRKTFIYEYPEIYYPEQLALTIVEIKKLTARLRALKPEHQALQQSHGTGVRARRLRLAEISSEMESVTSSLREEGMWRRHYQGKIAALELPDRGTPAH